MMVMMQFSHFSIDYAGVNANGANFVYSCLKTKCSLLSIFKVLFIHFEFINRVFTHLKLCLATAIYIFK